MQPATLISRQTRPHPRRWGRFRLQGRPEDVHLVRGRFSPLVRTDWIVTENVAPAPSGPEQTAHSGRSPRCRGSALSPVDGGSGVRAAGALILRFFY